MKSRNKKRLLALVLCMVVAISNSSFIFASETGQTEYPQEAEVQTQDEAVANDMDVAAYAADEGQAVADEQPAAVEQVAAEPETTAAAPAEQPAAEAPAAEQPTTEAPAAQEPAAAPTEEAPATEEEAPGTESALEGEKLQEETEEAVTYEQTVDGVKVVVTAPNASVLPENAELKVTKIEETEEIEQIKDTIAPEVVNNEASIKDMMAFDIKFVVGGEEVQPNGQVKVEFQNTGYDTENGISVYHVDDAKTTATDMDATVETQATENADVAIDTTHFSTYVIVNLGENEIKVTIQHYLYDEETEESSQLYCNSDDGDNDGKITIPSGANEGKLSEFTAENDEYELRSYQPIVKIVDGKDEELKISNGDILVDSDMTVRCYYVAKSGTYTNKTTMFDYDVAEMKNTTLSKKNWITIKCEDGNTYSGYYIEKTNALYSSGGDVKHEFTSGETFVLNPNDWRAVDCKWIGNGQYSYVESARDKGINSDSNYATGANSNNRMIMRFSANKNNEGGTNNTCMLPGKNLQGDSSGSYNINTGNANQPVIGGIVKGLDSNDSSRVIFGDGIYEPGFFSKERKIGKRILDDYSLNFTKNGSTYTLERVSDPKGHTVVAADENGNFNKFWPLDNDLGGKDPKFESEAADGGGFHNWFFGMRYDFSFSLGDYMGDMTYTFNGDDDLWVLLDGQMLYNGKTVLDLGGIHSGYPYHSEQIEIDYTGWLTAYPNTIDLWTLLAPSGKGNLTQEERNATHTVTVLYLERGGYGSNCKMSFVIPNVNAVQPVVSATPKAELTFDKKDLTSGEGIDDVGFTVYKTYNSETDSETGELSDEVTVGVSSDGGKVKIQGLAAGTYYMKETTVAKDYMPNNTIYIITVTSDGTTATATLKDSKGKLIDTIYNQKYEKAIEKSKTAQLHSWEKRTYDITLNASSKMQSGTVTGSVPIPNATVKDYIDDRFELTEETKEEIEKDPYAARGEDANGTYVIWTKQNILVSDGTTPGWTKTIHVRAKDEYIGGNDVPTNKSGSGVIVDGKLLEFEKPTVNVRIDFNIGKGETVIFKGDDLQNHFTKDVAKAITAIRSTTGTDYTIWDDVQNPVIIKWYKDEACTEEISENEIRTAVPESDTNYYAKVTVKPQKDGTASSGNSVGDEKGPNGYYRVAPDGVSKTGTYKVKVVSGEIQIEKKLESPATGKETFRFKVTRTDIVGQEPIEISIDIDKDSQSGTLSKEMQAKLKSLSRGTYEVTEIEENDYTIQKIEVKTGEDGTNCEYSGSSDNKVFFTLGSDKDSEDVIANGKYTTAGILGVVSFTNDKVTADWAIKKVSASNKDLALGGAVFELAPKDSSLGLPIYYGKSEGTTPENSTGIVKWYSDKNCTPGKKVATSSIAQGTYILSEISAPDPYLLNTDTWEITIAKNGALKSITFDERELPADKVTTVSIDGKETICYLYENQITYDLPSTGTPGIFKILMSGMLLMLVGVLFIYTMRRKGVLKQ